MAQIKGVLVQKQAGLRAICDDGVLRTITSYVTGEDLLLRPGSRIDGTIASTALTSVQREEKSASPEGQQNHLRNGGKGYGAQPKTFARLKFLGVNAV